MPVADFPTVFPRIMKCWLNRMVTSENGLVHTYMRCTYVHLQSCTYTYQMWVNEVFLDRRMTILHFFCILWHFLLIMGRSIIVHCFFVILTMCFIIFHCFFPNYMVQPKVILPPWWKDMDFKKKPVYRMRNPGGILTLFI